MNQNNLLNSSFENYEICYEKDLEEADSRGLVLKHKKSGARVCLVSNSDENKVFFIGFRTPPFNSTGVPHIIEHTVLCGSEKFPVKDPFIELAKSSLNTFLNAMTYPDKTLYPVASCNMQDIKNLMHVYMDAVFYPNIYHHEEIFKQEGWHFELPSPEDEITINGVVYNEMKGAYSSAEDLLDTKVNAALFPDNTYGLSSGGDPDVIPELSYEEYLDFHRRYYHPSNSYIYLYGDFDMEERLAWLDKEYLSGFDYQPVDSEIPLTASWTEPKYVTDSYPVGPEEDTKDKTYLSYNAVIGDILDVKRCMAWDVLDSVLFRSPGAPVRQALMDAGIGKDILSGFNAYTREPYFNLIAKDTEPDKLEEFISVVEKALKEQIENGLNRDSLLGAINISEFQYREADSGNYPKGLLQGLNIMNTWLYDDDKAFDFYFMIPVFEELRKEIGTGYYENLIKTDLLENVHKVYHTMAPEKGLTEKKEQALKEKLAEMKASLSEEEINKLVDDTKALLAYQEQEESPEAIATLPALKVSDMNPEAAPIFNREITLSGIKTIHHDVFTNGISYISLKFDVRNLKEEYWQYAALLLNVLGVVSTEKYSYLELANEINIHTGGISFYPDTFAVLENTDEFKAYMVVDTKILTDKTDKALELIAEIITSSNLKDKKRLKEIIGETLSSKQMSLIGAGHNTALNRAQSYFSPVLYFKEKTGGIDFYEFLKDIYINFDSKSDEITEKLQVIADCVLVPENMLISITSKEEGVLKLGACISEFKEKLCGRCSCAESLTDCSSLDFTPDAKNEAFKISGQIQYAATAGNYKKAGYSYTGALAVMKTILSYDYLWMNVRVKGGAYGCFYSYATISGNCGIVSYRDPNLARTYEVYRNAADYIRNLELDREEVDKYIIGTLSRTDVPKTPKNTGTFSFSCYASGVTQEYLQKERDEILGADLESIRATADILDCAVNQGYICTVGSAGKCTEDAGLFKEVKELQ
ncbi:MAG: insulinase family protein [Lachnospiraceae bacterium]